MTRGGPLVRRIPRVSREKIAANLSPMRSRGKGDGDGRDSVTGSSCARSSAEAPHRSQRADGSKDGGSKDDGECGEVDQDDDVSDTEEGTGTGGRCTDRKYRVRFSGEHVLVPLHHLTGDHCH
jgi:hypothetical protein